MLFFASYGSSVILFYNMSRWSALIEPGHAEARLALQQLQRPDVPWPPDVDPSD